MVDRYTHKGIRTDSVQADEDVRQFSWWNFQIDEQTGAHRYTLLNEAVDYISEFVRKEGPFDGVFGFSQGGMMASMLLQRQRTSLSLSS